MTTLLLTRSQVQDLLDPSALIDSLRAAFIAYSATSAGRARRVRSSLPGPGTATVLFPGTAPGIPAYSVKVHAKFPQQDPAIRGTLCLHDLETGDLLAVMDSTYLTAIRTGISGALAAHVLARPDAAMTAVIGAGVQGTYQLRFLAQMRPLRRVWVYDLVSKRAGTFAQIMSQALRIPVEAVSSPAEALANAEIALVATWSRQPFILPGMVARGAHITTLGPDEPGKAEVAAELIESGVFVCDDRDLAVELGALGAVGLGLRAVSAEFGEVLAASHPGRSSPSDLTIYGGVGLAFQDLVAAWHVYQAASRQRVGTEVDFLR
jgi:ornithine cyclodeaminase